MSGPYAALLDQAPLAELLEQVNAHRGQLAESMGVLITDIAEDSISATMPVAGNTQPVGLLHGGASAVLAETVGSIGAALHAGPARYPVGIELNCTHLSAARSGQVHAVARPLKLGRTLTSHSIEIRNDEGDLVCSARLTCLIRDR